MDGQDPPSLDKEPSWEGQRAGSGLRQLASMSCVRHYTESAGSLNSPPHRQYPLLDLRTERGIMAGVEITLKWKPKGLDSRSDDFCGIWTQYPGTVC